MSVENCDYETEKDSSLISVKNKINNIIAHHSSSALLNDADRGLEKTDLVSDVSLAKNNIAPSVYASQDSHDNYSQSFVSVPFERVEKNYQIRLLSVPDRHRAFTGEMEKTDPRQTELMTMFLMIMMVVIIAIILHLMMATAASREEEDSVIVYKLTAHKVNADPLLSRFRAIDLQ